LTPTYRELFIAIAECAGALTGLLFVALSVSPRRRHNERSVIQEVRAAAALLAFVNSLAIVGVARAWELVGDRDTGILSSIAVLSGREGHLGEPLDADEPELTAPMAAAEAAGGTDPADPATAGDPGQEPESRTD
jgi:hypothetical protein